MLCMSPVAGLAVGPQGLGCNQLTYFGLLE